MSLWRKSHGITTQMKPRRRTACPFETLGIFVSLFFAVLLLQYIYCHFPCLIIVLAVNVVNIDLHAEGGRTFGRPDRHVITKISLIFRLQVTTFTYPWFSPNRARHCLLFIVLFAKKNYTNQIKSNYLNIFAIIR